MINIVNMIVRLGVRGGACYSARMFVLPEVLNEDVHEATRRLVFWIEHRREELGISKNTFARLTSLSKNGLTYILKGEREPGLRSLCAIARALDMPLKALFEEIPDEQPG